MTDRETRREIKRERREKKIEFYFNNYERTRYYEEITWKIKMGIMKLIWIKNLLQKDYWR